MRVSGSAHSLRRAALLHDLGRVAIPSQVWDRPGRLSAADWEAGRLHPSYTECVLCRSQALGGYPQLAGMHHARLDGSGYHRQNRAPALPLQVQLLAAADAHQAMICARPHRPAIAAASAELGAEAGAHRLGPTVTAAVVAARPAANHRAGGPGRPS